MGIPVCLDERGRWRPGREYLYADLATARAVEKAGGVPVVLPPQADASATLERIDALLLPGGDDFPPPPGKPYPDTVDFDVVPEAQHRFDAALLAAALQRGLPVLGICYGAQLLALHHGGRLYHDIATDLPGASPHQLGEADGRHAVTIEPGSQLAALVGEAPGAVNSLHHQAIADPGHGMRGSAHAPDGVIEALESLGPGFCLGVQWHPEKLEAPASDALFRGLVAAAADATGRPG